MSDWEIVKDIQPDMIESKPQSDWSIVKNAQMSEPNSEESLGGALIKAPFRLGEDLIKSGFGLLKNIPDYLQSAKSGIPAAFNTLQKNPRQAFNQGIAGLAESGQNIFNTPHDIANYAANRLNLIPQDVNQKIQMARMPESKNEINEVFGSPENKGEEAIRWGGRNALAGMGAGKVASVLNPMNLTYKNIAKKIINTGDQNKKIYNKHYKKLWKEAENKGYQNMDGVAPNIDINILRKYSPQRSIAGLEDFINNPTLQNAHSAKSDLLRIQRDLGKLTTLKTAERKQFTAATNAINDIRDNMFKKPSGNIDENMLNRYEKIQQGYAKDVIPYKNKMINKYKRNEISNKELVNALSHGEFRAKRGKFHPEIGIREKIAPVTGTLGALAAADWLYNNAMGNHIREE